MNVLVIGGGGREHAIVEAVRRSAHKPHILCAPGNAGTEAAAENVPIAADNVAALTELAASRRVNLTIVGPEAPLCAGIVDSFRRKGLRIFGPDREGARLEGDKCHSKALLIESRIPTAAGRCFTRFDHAKDFIASRDSAVVVKAAGLAAGKGVVVCEDPSDAILAAERMMVDDQFGDAGRTIVVEEKLIGEELSVHAVIDGTNILMLETSQDHKRVGDGDTGPNTGGMGAYSPAPVATEAVLRNVEADILVPIVDTLRRHDIDYRGVLYCGIMVTAAGPKVLEFNCRFGDPEAQVLLTRLGSDFVDLVNACIDGTLDRYDMQWDPRSAVCVVAASGGYPGRYENGRPITGLDEAARHQNVTVYHAGTQRVDNDIHTNGGRVLGVTGLGGTIREARDRSYAAIEAIHFDGMHYRRDIADRALR